jgi:fructose-specific phosphotransferase system IIA component
MTGYNASQDFNWMNYINVNNVFTNFSAPCKHEAITKLVGLLTVDGTVENKDEYLASVLEREELGTTGLGEGVAMPHGKCFAVKRMSIALAKLDKPLDFESIDKKPVDYIFLIASPLNSDTLYIKVMASIIRSVKVHKICEKMNKIDSSVEIYEMLSKTVID